MRLRFDIVDVFTDLPFAGNRLAVVHDAGGLSGDQCLALAREFGFSETTFPVPTGPAGYDVRIYTPGGEVPFAGHPTLGTAWVLRREGALSGDAAVQECGVGPVPVRFGDDGGVSLLARGRDLPREVAADALLADVGLGPDDLTGPAVTAGCGLAFCYLPVTDAAVGRARPASVPLTTYQLATRDPLEGVVVYAVTGAGRVHARVFVPGVGVAEDAATGSAAAGLGLVLGGRFTIGQGAEMGRPSTLHVAVAADGVSVGGQVRAVATGRIEAPPGG